ncbi:HAD family hydrolase [bacterium]|nr:HAD family hydrolase [bacterium]
MINLKTNKWELNKIETILFDKDGTFIDLHYFWGKMTWFRCQKIVELYNARHEIVDELCLCLGFDAKKEKMIPDGITALYSRSVIIKMFKKDLEEKYGILISELELEKIFDDVSDEFYKDISRYVKPIDEAVEFIKLIRSKGLKTGIVTSDSIESTKLTLKLFGWENLFDCVVARESSKYTKESGKLTKIALEQLNANPKTTLMIGDTPIDYQSAINADVENVILVSSGQVFIDELEKYSKNCVNSLGEIEVF